MPRYDTEDIDKTSQDLQLEFLDESTYLADVEDNGDDDQDCVMNDDVIVGHYVHFHDVSYDTDDEDDDNEHQGINYAAANDDDTDGNEGINQMDVSEEDDITDSDSDEIMIDVSTDSQYCGLDSVSFYVFIVLSLRVRFKWIVVKKSSMS